MDNHSENPSGRELIESLRPIAQLPTLQAQIVELSKLSLSNSDFCLALLFLEASEVTALLKAQARNLAKQSGKPLSSHEKELAEGYKAAKEGTGAFDKFGDGPSQADLTAAMLREELTFIRDAMGVVYARDEDHLYCVDISSNEFLDRTLASYERRYAKIPQVNSVKNAISVVAAVARLKAPVEQIWFRIGGSSESEVWIDLCNENHEFVRLTCEGWEIQTGCPINFRRVGSMLPLPRPDPTAGPEEGLALLRNHLNMEEHDLIKFVAFVTEAMLPARQYPLLGVQGQADSAKSTACKVARTLVDPNAILLRGMPKSEDDLVIAARHNWINAFDNVSGISVPMSDSMCRVSTGGGLGKRKLYTDDEEKVFDDTRPIAINGLSDLANRHDLLTRTFSIELREIKEKVTDAEFWRRFNLDHSKILGWLLNFLSYSLRQSRTLNADSRKSATRFHRISDCSLRMVAGEDYAWSRGTWEAAMAENAAVAREEVLDDSVIWPALCDLMSRSPEWRGEAKGLLHELEFERYDEIERKADGSRITRERKQRRKLPQRWPVNPRGLSTQLRAITPALAKRGVKLVMRPSHGRRIIEWSLDEKTRRALADVM